MLGSSSSRLWGDALVLSSTNIGFNCPPCQKLGIRAASGQSSNPDAGNSNANSWEQQQREKSTPIFPKSKKKGWQWSKGDAPGEYGGPPTEMKLRKYWGDNSDPITATDDFIWNKSWLGHIKVPQAEPTELESPQEEQEAGFLSLNRAMALDSIEVDLSQDLMKPSKSILEQQVEAARLGLPTDQTIKAGKPRWRIAPTRREQLQWDRASKAETGGTGLLIRNLNRNREDPAVIAARSKEQYIKLKQSLQLLTLGLGGLGTVSAYISYSPEVAASFGAGLLGSLAYIRMLGNSVDSYAKKGVQGAVRGALGQPRLLVPVMLVMIYNRWNQILVPEYGLIHLDLIPMLVGFFTYKIATFAQALRDIFPVIGGKP